MGSDSVKQWQLRALAMAAGLTNQLFPPNICHICYVLNVDMLFFRRTFLALQSSSVLLRITSR
jgi:hypothetical protein